jgi:flavorubredoxin
MSVQLRDGIYWVGAIDWNLRDFHGYITGRGATYNSYLIIDEKVTLIDTVKAPFLGEMLDRIRQIIDPSKIDYLICNHIEKDHSGSLAEFHRLFPKVKIYATQMAKPGLQKYFGDLPLAIVKTGDSLPLGRRTLQFIETPMVHWPDSMFSYLPEDKLLFSMDGFGQHIATAARFDDEVDMHDVMFEARKYYANLLTHLSPLIQATLKKVGELKLEIDMIAPSHGIIWRKDPGLIIKAYDGWSRFEAGNKVSVVFDTMWQSTEKMAKIMAEVFMSKGVEVKLMKLREWHRSDVMAEILDSKAVCIGSPTLHRNLYPTVADLLCYMKGLKPQKKIAAAFGSYGWSGESMQMVTDELKAIGLDVIEPGMRAQYLPDAEDTAQLTALAEKIIEKIKA